jgi:hypothetical protein
MKYLIYILIALLSWQSFAKGIPSSQTRPRVRIGTLPYPFFMYRDSEDNFGKHEYYKAPLFRSKEEDRGIFYTCRAGFIDMAHLRAGIDYGAYFVKKN